MSITDNNVVGKLIGASKIFNKNRYKKGITSALPRLYVFAEDYNNIRISNSGPIPAYNCCCNIFIQHPVVSFINVIPYASAASNESLTQPSNPSNSNNLSLIKSFSFSLSANESISFDLKSIVGSPAFFSTYYLFVYDPVLDPFPMNSIENYTWCNSNFLKNHINPGVNPPVLNWEEWISDRANFSNAEQLTGNKRTWKGELINPPIQSLINNNTCFFAGKTAKKYSKLKQTVNFSDIEPSIGETLRKGNLLVSASAFLNKWRQSPRDQGNLVLEVLRGNQQLTTIETGYDQTTDYTWKKVSLSALLDSRATSVAVNMCAKRNAGDDNDAYFAQVQLKLKHRQVDCVNGISVWPFWGTLGVQRTH